jgi:KRAB domain-containing zinc finger protein
MSVHLKRRDFKCDHCDKAFGQKQHLNMHINSIHKKIKKFWCDLCDYSSYQRVHMEQHSNIVHLKKKEFKCDHCDKAYSQKRHLADHVNSIHTKLISYSCELCNYISYAKSDLRKHSILKHSPKTVQFKCDHCDKAYTQKKHLADHVNSIHTKLISYSCELCNYISYDKSDLRKHSILKHSPKTVHRPDLDVLMKEAQKDEMGVLVENSTVFECILGI